MKNWEKIRNNPELKQREINRSLIFRWIREFFNQQGFYEIQCPLLLACPGMEPYLEQIGLDLYDEKRNKYRGYLSTSPEYSMKKMLSAGFEKIYNMASAFRGGESFGGTHNIEFTILEWYRANADYTAIMEDVEDLAADLAKKLHGTTKIAYQGQEIELAKPWQRMTVREACQKYAGFDLNENKEFEQIKKTALNKGYKVADNATWDDVFYLMLLNEVEPNFPKDRPIILCEYPLPQAALSKPCKHDPWYAERFEYYIGGIEIGNCFSELVDGDEQLKRLQEEQKMKKDLGKEVLPIDMEFIKALKMGVPDSSGIAIGVDRLQMILLDVKDINDLLPFPDKDLFDLE